MTEHEHFEDVDAPAGGWGSAKEVSVRLAREHVLLKGARVLTQQN